MITDLVLDVDLTVMRPLIHKIPWVIYLQQGLLADDFPNLKNLEINLNTTSRDSKPPYISSFHEGDNVFPAMFLCILAFRHFWY